ncbi:hypothetical protein [Flavobacterium gelatinilyticum]|uniref:hypothetical protein n=1 Tax=Flavobacterium gelatinilyticum TaxID=3003260 RepID=UPI0024817726|nr:hypothetical protein [Flavobacterium gelatinilyticum]
MSYSQTQAFSSFFEIKAPLEEVFKSFFRSDMLQVLKNFPGLPEFINYTAKKKTQNPGTAIPFFSSMAIRQDAPLLIMYRKNHFLPL